MKSTHNGLIAISGLNKQRYQLTKLNTNERKIIRKLPFETRDTLLIFEKIE